MAIVIKGTSNNLFKMTAKRRRSKAEIKEEKRLDTQRKDEIADKLAQMEQMQKQMNDMAAEM